jgi:hypothetical protein
MPPSGRVPARLVSSPNRDSGPYPLQRLEKALNNLWSIVTSSQWIRAGKLFRDAPDIFFPRRSDPNPISWPETGAIRLRSCILKWMEARRKIARNSWRRRGPRTFEPAENDTPGNGLNIGGKPPTKRRVSHSFPCRMADQAARKSSAGAGLSRLP